MITIPLWVLLAFAMWTVLTLLCTVGVYRWSRILSGRGQLKDFPATNIEGSDWYKRAMRAHANCLENLPVYGSIAVVAWAARVDTPALDVLALTVMGGRIVQTLIHVALPMTNPAIAVRFAAFFTQIICMVWMAVIIVCEAA